MLQALLLSSSMQTQNSNSETLSPDSVRGLLDSTAVNMYTTGFDYLSGFDWLMQMQP